MQFTDAVTVAGTRRRDDGYLVADARVARTGIQTYAGWEVGKPDMPVVRVYRPAEEVFSRDAMASFAHRPITNEHPDESVTADNWREYSVGQSGDEIARDGVFLRIPLMVADGKTVSEIEAGKRELSAGYTATLDWTAGKTPDGEDYDAVQRKIRANHIAVVRHGRAGSQVRIGDDAANWGAAPISTTDKETITMSDALRTVVVDGLSVQTTDQGAQAIDKLMKDKAAVEQRLADAEKAHADAIKAKDAEIAQKDEEIGTLKADKKKLEDAAPKPEDLDKMVADRAALVTTVKAIDSKIEPKGMSDADLRKAAVAAKLGDEMVKDASEDQISGMFKAIAKDVKTADPFAEAVKNGVQTQDGDKTVTDAYAAMVKDMESVHLPPKAN